MPEIQGTRRFAIGSQEDMARHLGLEEEEIACPIFYTFKNADLDHQ